MKDPLFVTVARTVRQIAGHTDVSLWYVLKGRSLHPLNYDTGEFHHVQWFSKEDVPYERADPHLLRFVNKLSAVDVLN